MMELPVIAQIGSLAAHAHTGYKTDGDPAALQFFRCGGQGGMLAIIAVLFVIPIIYNYTIGRKAA